MTILLTNDDGIHAKGLDALYGAVTDLGDVLVVAPDREMSASAHSVTMTSPLRATRVSRNGTLWGYAVSGTPSDAAKLALTTLIADRPDLVISGINQGVNTGLDSVYSGTVSAASEGSFLGIPSMAVSLASSKYDDFSPAAVITRELVDRIIHHKLTIPRFSMLNVNVPPIPLQDMKGFRITRQGMGGFRDGYVTREDPRGISYYWINGSGIDIEDDEQADHYAIRDGYVTITPLRFDLTDYDLFDMMRSMVGDLHPGDLG